MAPQRPNAPAQVVQAALNQTNPGLLEHHNRVGRFNRAYEVYRGQVKPSRTMKPWQTKLYIKYGMQVIDQAMVNLIQGSPQPICKPRRQQDVASAKAMEVALRYYADLDHLAEKEALVNAQALIYGVSPGKTEWYYKEQTINGPSGPTRVVECDRPCFIPWDAYDCWWDPNSRDVDNASYVVLRDWLTKEQLEQRRYDSESGTGSYQNLDLLYRSGQGGQPPQTAQNNLIPQATNPYKDRFEIWEIWRDNRLTVIGNRNILLKDGPKPFWMKGKPVVISNTRPDMFRIEGVSETELVDHIQQALHMVTNLRMDNWKFSVMRGYTYRENGVTDPTRLVMRPGFAWPVTDHNDVEFKDQPPLPAQAYQEEEVLLGRLQYVTGISPYITGAVGTGVDQNTATGVSLLHETASRLLAFKANRIRMLTWQRVFEQWGDLTKQFLTSSMAVRIEGPGSQITWQEVGPEDVQGDFDIRIQAGEESLNRQQKRAEAIAVVNAFAPWVQQGLVNPQPLLEMVAEAYDLPDRTTLFPNQPPPPPQAAPNGGSPNGAGYTPNIQGGGIVPYPAQSYLQGNQR